MYIILYLLFSKIWVLIHFQYDRKKGNEIKIKSNEKTLTMQFHGTAYILLQANMSEGKTCALKTSAHTDVMQESASFMLQAEHGCLRS